MTENKSLSPIMNVGRDFTQGNILGQNAIGCNISQAQYNNCTFVYPDGSTRQGYSWISIQGFRPIIDSKKIFGREKELDSIEELLKDKNAIVITGVRGTGKSTLTSMFVDKMVENRKFAGIYWRKIDETTDIEEIIGSFFSVIGKPVKDLERYKIPDQINLLFKELNEASYLLVLDNFEILLDPQTNKPLKSKVGFSELIENLNENCVRSKILFTSWDSLASERGIRPFSYLIRGLDISAGTLLLKREGLNESETELKKAVELSGGHPLALILLAQLVKEEADTLSALLNDSSLWDGEVAENILNKVYNERLSEDERKLIQYVSIFRQPESAKGICTVANNFEWTEAKVKRIALSLTRKSLLQNNDGKYWEESLISKYAENQLSEKSKLHKLAVKYYLSLPIILIPNKKEDLRSEIEAYYHACKAEEYDLAVFFIEILDLKHFLDFFGEKRLLIYMYEQILPKDHLKGEPVLKEKRNHAGVLANIGLQYVYLGECKKSIEYSKKALTIATEISDMHGKEVALGNLGLAHKLLDEPEKAIEYYKCSLVIAQTMGNRIGERNNLGNLGAAYLSCGEFRQAFECSQQALTISIELASPYEIGRALGNLGLVFLTMGKPEKAIDEYLNSALKIARETGDRLGEGRALGFLGLAYSEIGEKDKAFELLSESLAFGKLFEDPWIISTYEQELNKLERFNE